MRNRVRTLAALAILLILALGVVGTAAAASSRNFRAHLAGRNEVPAADTNAQGQAIFNLSKDEQSLAFKLIVANIEDVTAAHIHCGAVGVAGPVGVNLFLGPATGGRFDGILAQGTITSPNPGNSCGWADLDAVLAAILSGNAYVNVHTSAIPSGEIRGQIH